MACCLLHVVLGQGGCVGCLCADMNQFCDWLTVKADPTDTSVISDVHLDERRRRQTVNWTGDDGAV